MKKPVLFGVIFVLIVLGVIVYSTLTLAKHRVEVCMQFNGRTNCKTASATTEEFAHAGRGHQRLRGDCLRSDRNRGLRALRSR